MSDAATLRQVRDAVQRGERTAVDICTAVLDRIARHDETLNAFNTVTREQALARAAAIDRDPRRASLPLAGVPVAVKDNLCTRGVATTASSRILEVHGQRMIDEAFAPGFRMRLHRKDLSLAVDAGKTLDLALPNTAATQ